MTRHLLVSVIATILLLASTSASVSGEDGGSRLSGDDLVIIDGVQWTKDIRISRNSAGDTQPQIVVDGSDVAHIIWQRAGYWTLTFDSKGNPLSKEVYITPHVVRGYGSPTRYPLGPQIAIDSQAYIHVVWDDGWQNCYYQKFDPDANTISSVIHLGAQDNMASHTPCVGIDPDDDVHYIHDDYQYQCEDILYGKLDNDGRVLVKEFSLSAAVSSHCEHSTLTTDDDGNVHVVFGSSTGCWWRKVDSMGVAQGNAVRIDGLPTYMIPDVACTPNGDVHLVWTADGTVRYTRMANNGTMLDVNVSVSKGGVQPGPPRIAANHEDDTVHIVWHDLRDGSAEIYYAKMENGSFNATPKNVRLTDHAGNSFYPWIAVSPEDSVHVAWQDMRDGNWEVYYKFMANFRMDLHPVQASELADMYFFRPRETKDLHMYIENLGVLSDDYEVAVKTDDWAEADGWSFSLNATELDDVPGNSSVFFHLDMTSPADAEAGDYVNVTVTATSASGDSDKIAWRAFVIVDKAVSVECAEPTLLVTPGNEVRFDLTVTNVGDVRDDYRVEHVLIPEDAVWEVTVDKESLSLVPDGASDLTVRLRAPEEARTNDNATVFLRVSSMTDASVWDGKKLMAIVDPDFHLEMEAPVPKIYVDPAGSVEFPIIVRNTGKLPGILTIYVTSSVPRPGWRVTLSDDRVVLGSGEEHVLTLTVAAPADAVAGSRQDVKINAVSEDYSHRSSVKVSAVVDLVQGVRPIIQSIPPTLHAGDEGRVQLDITNEGNANELLALGSTVLPPGWDISFEVDGVAVQNVTIGPRETRSVDVVVSTPPYATAGNAPQMYVVLTDSSGGSHTVPLHVSIHPTYAVDLSTASPWGAGGPSGTVTYHLVVHNEGNTVDTFVLDHGPLPGSEWSARFHGTDGTTVSSVTLDGGERRDIELRVRIPRDVDITDPFDLLVSTTSTSAETDEVRLVLDVLLADVKILSVEYYPSRSTSSRPTQVTIQVANEGSAPAEDVTVAMLVDWREMDREVVGTLEVGSTTNISFDWTPKEGRYTLTYRVSTGASEANTDNNELDHIKTVVGEGPSQAGFVALIVLLTVASVVIAVLVRRWRQS